MRRPAVLLVAIGLMVASAPARGAEPPVAPAVAVVPPSPAAARAVPVQGTAEQRAVARRWLARLGPSTAIDRLRFRWIERRGPGLRIDVAPSAVVESSYLQPLAWWHVQLLSQAIVRDIRDRGGWLQAVEVYAGKRLLDGGSTYVPRPSLHAPTARQLADETMRRAARRGMAVSGTVRSTSPAALALTVQLQEEDLFATPAGWDVDPVLPPRWYGERRRYDLYLDMLAPDGRSVYLVAQSASAGLSSVGPGFRDDAPVPAEPPPAELVAADSHLQVVFGGFDIVTGAERHVEVALTCGAAPSGVPDAAAVCDRVLRDRWALLGQSAGGCIGGVPSATVEITGDVAGHPVQRGYGQCGGPVQRWADTLGVTLG